MYGEHVEYEVLCITDTAGLEITRRETSEISECRSYEPGCRTYERPQSGSVRHYGSTLLDLTLLFRVNTSAVARMCDDVAGLEGSTTVGSWFVHLDFGIA